MKYELWQDGVMVASVEGEPEDARREILHPRGMMALREQWETWRLRTATAAYRALWAPGRPAHGLVRRVRTGPGRPDPSIR